MFLEHVPIIVENTSAVKEGPLAVGGPLADAACNSTVEAIVGVRNGFCAYGRKLRDDAEQAIVAIPCVEVAVLLGEVAIGIVKDGCGNPGDGGVLIGVVGSSLLSSSVSLMRCIFAGTCLIVRTHRKVQF